MNVPIFLSYPWPFEEAQERFIHAVASHLRNRGLEPRTLGVNEYDNEIPLRAIRRLMMESNGVLAIAFRRYHVERGAAKPRAAGERDLSGAWFTSPWPQIEIAMGYTLGLPIMVLREAGVTGDGVLERGTVDIYVPEVDMQQGETFLRSGQWTQVLGVWEANVRTVARNKGMPPKLY